MVYLVLYGFVLFCLGGSWGGVELKQMKFEIFMLWVLVSRIPDKTGLVKTCYVMAAIPFLININSDLILRCDTACPSLFLFG